MSVKVHLRPQARVDLIEIADFIANDRIAVAERFLTAAEASFGQLAENPELGNVGEFDSRFLEGIRRWRIKGFENYLVFYRVMSDGIEIVRVLHGARDIDQAFDPKP